MWTSDTDLYALLGVAPDADERVLKSAFRQQARKHHPDLNPGDEDAQQRFVEIAAAFEILSDPARRSLYDEFGLESLREGFDPHAARQRPYGWAEEPKPTSSPFDLSGFGSVFSEAFKRAYNPFTEGAFKDAMREDPFAERGEDVYDELRVPLMRAITGGIVGFLHNDAALAVRVPAGVEDGEEILVTGEGGASPDGKGPAGDLWLTVRIEMPSYLSRDGLNLTLTLPVSMTEALLGAKIPVPTPHGECLMTLPEGIHGGARLRLKGMGVHHEGAQGDMYVVIQIKAPTHLDAELRQAARTLERGYREPLRAHIEFE